MKNKIKTNAKKERIYKKLLLTIKIAAAVTVIIFPCFFNILTGAGWIANSGAYGEIFNTYGIVMIISSAVMGIAVILCCLKLAFPAAAADIIGFIPIMVILHKASAYADSQGWNSKYTMELVSDMYRNRILPTIIPFVLIAAAAVMEYFSYSSAVKRRIKREQKEKERNEKTIKILDD